MATLLVCTKSSLPVVLILDLKDPASWHGSQQQLVPQISREEPKSFGLADDAQDGQPHLNRSGNLAFDTPHGGFLAAD